VPQCSNISWAYSHSMYRGSVSLGLMLLKLKLNKKKQNVHINIHKVDKFP